LTNDARKYRFLFVSAPFSGIEVFMRNLHEVVRSDDTISAEWLFLEKEIPELISHIPPISMNWTLKGGLVARRRINTLEKKGGRFDAALFNHIVPATLIKDFRRRTPIVLSLDATPALLNQYAAWYLDRKPERSWLLRRLKNSLTTRVYQNAKLILPWSIVVEKSLVCDYGIPSSKMEVVPPGIDLKLWDCAPPDDRAKLRVLFVGADFMRKGGDILLELARKEDFREVEFDFVTNESVQHEPPNTHFHRNIRPNSYEIRSLYRSASVFALPTRADLSPNAICEAMASGLPVVATDVGGISELVSNNVTGYLVPPGQPQMFARALKNLIKDRTMLISMGKSARLVAREKFNLEKNSREIIQHLKNIARDKSASLPSISLSGDGA